jgi:hypothetical protein
VIDLIKKPISKMVEIPDEGIFQVYKDRWWSTDGENIFFYRGYGSPQCNRHKTISERLGARRGHGVVFLPRVFVPHDCREFL